MSKISELSDGGSLQSTDYLIAVRSGGNVKVQLSELPSGIGAGGNIVFGDNEKAIFGAGSDLQIYHDGTDSYITDTTGGNLFINEEGAGYLMMKGSDLYFRNPSNADMIHAQSGGYVKLYHNGSEKLATASTGIDVTGTVTADGLTVDGNGTIQSDASSSVPTLTLKDTDTSISSGQSLGRLSFSSADNSPDAAGERAYIRGLIESGGTSYGLELGAMVSGGSPANRLSVSGSGDISFYDSAGSSQSFFWDASAEALGIGTTSPSRLLHINSAGVQIGALIESTSTLSARLALANANTTSTSKVGIGAIADDLVLYAGGLQAVTVDDSGNVGIGTTSPSDLLDISANGTSAMRLSDSSTPATYAQITQANGVLTFAADAGNAQTGSNMQFEVDGTESMRIDSSGNVGIGTTSPATNLEVSDATNPTIRITNSTAALGAADVGSLEFFTDDLSISAARVLASIVCVNRGTSPSIPDGELVFKTSVGGAGPLPATEKMRLDQNGNLLVGTTSAVIANSSSNVGTAIGAGLVESARAGVVAQLNRHTSDGSILDFQKDGTTVGSIGSAAGQDIVIGSGSAGLRFLSTGPAIQPRNADGTANNDAIDLGLSTNRFKDLYLSGGVYLGGTGAGNLLDDYETGTFTPTVYSSDNTTVLTSGVDYTLADYRYVKTGNHVMMEIRIRDLRVIKTDIWCTIPFTSLTSDAGVGITAEGDVMYLASNRLNLRKGTNQYPYGIVNFESS